MGLTTARQTGWRPPPRRYRTGLLDGFDARDQVFVVGTVLVANRLGGVVEGLFLLGGEGDELHACGFEFGFAFGGFFVPDHSLFHLRFTGQFLHQRLLLGAELGPGGLGDNDRLGEDQVVGPGEVLGVLVVVVFKEG